MPYGNIIASNTAPSAELHVPFMVSAKISGLLIVPIL